MPNNMSIEDHMVATALQQLTRDPVIAEYNRRPIEEKSEFMMAFACYVTWLIMIGASRTYESGQVEGIVKAIHSAYTKRDWYRTGLFEDIWNSIQHSLPNMKPGRHTGVLIALVHVIEAANRAGCHLQHTTDAAICMDSSLIVNQLIQAAASPRTKSWWQFWK